MWSVRRGWLAGLLLVSSGFQVQAGLKVYFLRHAEGGHNAVKQWQDKPREQWPAYVGNENMFTPKGEEQVASLQAKLAPYRFDCIVVSPLWRTRNTILPYLMAKNAKAEIWPELEEFDFQESAPPLPPASEDLLQGGPTIELPDKERAFFVLRDDALRRIKVGKSKEQSRADVKALMDKLAASIESRFGGRDVSILIVGHGNSGSLLYRRLVGQEKPEWPVNASLWMVEQQADGQFKLRMFNDKPYP